MRRWSDRNDGATTCGGDMKAFPEGTINSGGMDLRDYFAAKAMQGLIAHFDFDRFKDDPLRVARWAYDAADAMMKAREPK